jgi:hypothetical protein
MIYFSFEGNGHSPLRAQKDKAGAGMDAFLHQIEEKAS